MALCAWSGASSAAGWSDSHPTASCTERHAEAHPVRLDSSGAGPSDLRHCYMCEARDSGQWLYWPPKGGPNRGQPPHHRVSEACRMSLANGGLVKEQHRASRCGLDYECPDGACGPNGC
jgi:hypothetical protein